MAGVCLGHEVQEMTGVCLGHEVQEMAGVCLGHEVQEMAGVCLGHDRFKLQLESSFINAHTSFTHPLHTPLCTYTLSTPSTIPVHPHPHTQGCRILKLPELLKGLGTRVLRKTRSKGCLVV